VLKTNVSDGQYTFLTQNNGKDTVKSPADMFPAYAIDNDLWYVDQKIRNYYEFEGHASDEDVKQMDQAVAKPDVTKEAAEGKRRRRSYGAGEVRAETTEQKQERLQKEAEQAVAEATAEPAKRRRKARNAEKENQTEEAPAEEKKEEATAEQPAEGRKRRRKKHDSEAEQKELDGFLNVPEMDDEELPFV
jgi:hypothetical protein